MLFGRIRCAYRRGFRTECSPATISKPSAATRSRWAPPPACAWRTTPEREHRLSRGTGGRGARRNAGGHRYRGQRRRQRIRPQPFRGGRTENASTWTVSTTGPCADNTCVNRKRQEDYPSGHFGVVMNNTDPDMHSQNIEIAGNVLDGMKFGGLYLIGSGHRVTGNRFLHLNTAGCNESAAQVFCIYKRTSPGYSNREST